MPLVQKETFKCKSIFGSCCI